MCFSESPHHDKASDSESSGTRSSPSSLTISDLERSLNVDFLLSPKAFDGDDGMEKGVPPAEVTLTETLARSLSLGFDVDVDRVPRLGVEDVDKPGGDLELPVGNEGEDMKFKNVAVAQERWE